MSAASAIGSAFAASAVEVVEARPSPAPARHLSSSPQFGAGAMLSAFGVFWTGEGLALLFLVTGLATARAVRGRIAAGGVA